MTTDWKELARRLGSTHESGDEQAGTELARAALEHVIETGTIRSAVDHYITGAPGSELARSVLWHLHPWSGMQRCHEVYSSSPDVEVRRRAVELLRVVADRRALPWIAGYLADADALTQAWAAGIVDQLLFTDLADVAECGPLLHIMAHHSNDTARERHAFIMEYLAQRDGAALPLAATDEPRDP